MLGRHYRDGDTPVTWVSPSLLSAGECVGGQGSLIQVTDDWSRVIQFTGGSQGGEMVSVTLVGWECGSQEVG